MSLRESLRIMVVDDMSTSRGLILQALEAIGVNHVTSASGGQDAIDAIRVSPVHLVISDFNMPGMDGIQLLERIRQDCATQRLGFIIVTGRADQQILIRGQPLGLNNLIEKPFSAIEMKTCIERVGGRL
ncbi:MAG: response regulator [Halocynthiibacter sp.]